MIKFLLNIATKGSQDFNDSENRLRIGYLASIVGLIINVILSITKLIIGVLISSISVIADGVNNLSDSASSIITLVGFKISNMPPDREHPHGHGRVEYISALMVSFMVILVGIQFIKSSYDRIINPKAVKFELIPFVILLISITAKIWLSRFNKDLGEKIDSSGLKATAADALGDVLTTSVVVLSLVIGKFTTLPIDGFVGMVVAILIIYSGYNLVKETISPLIGEAPPKELINSIYRDILSYDYVTGAHDLTIHSYGHGKTMATIDVEFPSNIDTVTIHDIIDFAEREIGKRYNLHLVIHMDPLYPESEERYELRQQIKQIIKENPNIKSMHDFQIFQVEGEKVVEFHLVLDGNALSKQDNIEDIKAELERNMEKRCKGIKCNLVMDVEY
ncbi:cation diffusion facilitator family transporter [Paratissierella segnis]|uniref:cation diffusion facilitator family transporter n=1 Tax=Paratissierella segnis TaxID=2763679 RepID=UPI00223BA4A0|nr:cation diffusion facilitator family transporter [Paratissierella segnis]